jgi:hypothetical protein
LGSFLGGTKSVGESSRTWAPGRDLSGERTHMIDHKNNVNAIAVTIHVQNIIDVQDLLTEATRALLNRDWNQASNAIELADKQLRGKVVPGVARRLKVAA